MSKLESIEKEIEVINEVLQEDGLPPMTREYFEQRKRELIEVMER